MIVQVGAEGVLLVDTQTADDAPRVFGAVRTLSPEPIRWIVNTSARIDHMGGNDALAGSARRRRRSAGLDIVSHQNVVRRLRRRGGRFARRLAERRLLHAHKDFFFNGEAVIVTHMPAARTDGDSIVFFRRSDVISHRRSVHARPISGHRSRHRRQRAGLIDALNASCDLAVPGKYQEGGTYVIPGHGRICDEADVVEYRDMVTIVRDRVQDLIKKGMTLEQVKAAQAHARLRRRILAAGSTTPDVFVEAVYRESHENARHVHESPRCRRSRLAAACSCCRLGLLAQPPGRGGPPAPPKTPKDAAPVDLTGYWVSVVTEDWRWRMVTPIKGDFASLPSIPKDARSGCRGIRRRTKRPAKQCKAYGAAAIMRMPGRLHITWQDERTLKIETDAGTQTRLLHFGGQAAEPPARPVAGLFGRRSGNNPCAEPARRCRDSAPRGRVRGGRSLEVVTTQLRPGYLRKNGAPYSANAVVVRVSSISRRSATATSGSSSPPSCDDPAVSDRAVRHQHELQETAGCIRVESNPLLRALTQLRQRPPGQFCEPDVYRISINI